MRFFDPLLLALAAACGPKSAPAAASPTPPYPYAYAEAADRLEGMTVEGLILSFDDARQRPAHVGDRLIWTGIAMGVLDCPHGAAQEAALLDTYAQGSLPPDWHLDPELGLLYGIVKRAARCPGSRDAWAREFPAHAAAIRGGLPLSFGVAVQETAHVLGLADEPSPEARGPLGAEVAAWTAGVVAEHAAAFRIHLGYLALSIVDAPGGKSVFCRLAVPARMPLIEQFCGRPGLQAWAHAFQYDRMEYALQRAVWETEVNPATFHTPALDYLVALRELGAAP